MIGKVKVTSTEPASHDSTLPGEPATKEGCKHALDNLLTQERFMNEYAFNIIKDFLEKCLKRLPSQAAVDKDRQRKKGKKS